MLNQNLSSAQQTFLYMKEGWRYLGLERQWVQALPADWTITVWSLLVLPLQFIYQFMMPVPIIGGIPENIALSSFALKAIIFGVFLSMVYLLASIFGRKDQFPRWLLLFNIFAFWSLIFSVLIELIFLFMTPVDQQKFAVFMQDNSTFSIVNGLLGLAVIAVYIAWVYLSVRDGLQLSRGKTFLFMMLFLIIAICGVSIYFHY